MPCSYLEYLFEMGLISSEVIFNAKVRILVASKGYYINDFFTFKVQSS